jgi:hypothetical protein
MGQGVSPDAVEKRNVSSLPEVEPRSQIPRPSSQ